jgi:hypothetical protein
MMKMMVTTTHYTANAASIALVLVSCYLVTGASASSSFEPIVSSTRSLCENSGEAITTTACTNIRSTDSYPARMDLTYLYTIEHTADFDATGIERALATSVASTLNSCDKSDRPIYAVELDIASQHKVISGGAPFPGQGTTEGAFPFSSFVVPINSFR